MLSNEGVSVARQSVIDLLTEEGMTVSQSQQMLSYEEEIALSDLLVARRSVTDTLSKEERDADPEEARIIRKGDRAATALVESYLPHIQAVASRLISRTAKPDYSQLEDLIQEGVYASLLLTRSYNLRGKNNHSGRRFANYSELNITKRMKQFLARISTPMKIDVAVIQASWIYISAQNELRDQLGREPTPEEVEEKTNISSTYVFSDLPHRSSFLDVDDPANADVASAHIKALQIEADHLMHSAALKEALLKVFNPELTDVILSHLGVDRMYPRMADDMAEHLGMGKRAAEDWLRLANSALIHPKYRLQLRRAIEQSFWRPTATESGS